MRLESCHSRRLPFACLVIVLGLTSGCALMVGEKSGSLPVADQAGATPPQNGASITVEVRAAGNKPEIQPVRLDKPLRIQEALEQTGLTKRFRRMNIHLMRVSGDQRHKLDSKYSHNDGFVNPLYDYALRPGDHLVVSEDTTNLFDDMLNSVTGPVKRGFGG